MIRHSFLITIRGFNFQQLSQVINLSTWNCDQSHHEQAHIEPVLLTVLEDSEYSLPVRIELTVLSGTPVISSRTTSTVLYFCDTYGFSVLRVPLPIDTNSHFRSAPREPLDGSLWTEHRTPHQGVNDGASYSGGCRVTHELLHCTVCGEQRLYQPIFMSSDKLGMKNSRKQGSDMFIQYILMTGVSIRYEGLRVWLYASFFGIQSSEAVHQANNQKMRTFQVTLLQYDRSIDQSKNLVESIPCSQSSFRKHHKLL